MPINSFLYPGAKFTPAYEVANSVRFNDGSSDSLSRTPSSTGSQQIGTWSYWIKRADITAYGLLYSIQHSGEHFEIWIAGDVDDNTIEIRNYNGSSYDMRLITNRKFRDVSAWYHIVVALDTTQGTDSNRIKLYINGVQETSFSTATYPSVNHNFVFSQTSATKIGTRYNDSNFFDGYMAEVVFIDGQALDPTSFGEFDEDSPTIWKPKDVSGLTFGTNGFYLDFENSSALGNDVSGNDNDFTANNLAATDQSTDTCTNNYATFNPLDNYYLSGTFSEGNLKVSIDNNSTEAFTTSTIGVSSGKWYMENKIITTSSGRLYSGVTYGTAKGTNDWPGGGSDQWFYRSEDGKVYNEGSEAYTGATLADGDIVGIALDLDNHKLYFSKNGTFNNSGDPTSGSTGTGAIALDTGQTYFFAVGESGDTAVVSSANFGSPSFSISSGNSDANGYGNFEYSVPSGYYSINSKNLAEFG
jgi:hypothetical protein